MTAIIIICKTIIILLLTIIIFIILIWQVVDGAWQPNQVDTRSRLNVQA